ncbi:MAG TPA: arginase family protein [Steroidobacteraceae bacterium]
MMKRAAAALTIFAGRVGDRNPRGMHGAVAIGNALAQRLEISPTTLSSAKPPLAAGWQAELDAAAHELREIQQRIDQVMTAGRASLMALGRCAASIATLPIVARHHPDACVVWFDAHGDSNLPSTTATGYLGGMVLSGASGRWPTGWGDDLDLANVILVGARDLDPSERGLIAAGVIRCIAPGPDLAAQLSAAIGDGPVYIHLDCDALEPGLVPVEVPVPGGLSLADLRGAAEILARNDVVGLEIAEYEATWAHTGLPGDSRGLLEALHPILARICAEA